MTYTDKITRTWTCDHCNTEVDEETFTQDRDRFRINGSIREDSEDLRKVKLNPGEILELCKGCCDTLTVTQLLEEDEA